MKEYQGAAVFGLAIIGFALISIIMAFPTMFLWNTCLVKAVNFANPISFWTAFGLNFLASIFFKNSTLPKSKKANEK